MEKLTYSTEQLLLILSANTHSWMSTETESTHSHARTRTQLPMLHVYLIKWQLALLRLHHPPYSLYDSLDASCQTFFPSSFHNITKAMMRHFFRSLFLSWFYQNSLFSSNIPPQNVEQCPTENTGLGSFKTWSCSGVCSHNWCIHTETCR